MSLYWPSAALSLNVSLFRTNKTIYAQHNEDECLKIYTTPGQ